MLVKILNKLISIKILLSRFTCERLFNHIVILIILGMVALFYLLFALAYVLEPLVGGLMASFAIIAGINILIMALVIIFRKQLIISPMVNFLANLFLTDSK